MVTDSKRIRTRKGDNMMFATLDDLEGAVEMIVFAKGVEEYGAVIEGDGVLLVRGRVEHKDGGDIKLVPDDVKVVRAHRRGVGRRRGDARGRGPTLKRLTIEVAGHVPETFLDDLKDLCRNNPGEHELELWWAGGGCAWVTATGCRPTARAWPSWTSCPAPRCARRPRAGRPAAPCRLQCPAWKHRAPTARNCTSAGSAAPSATASSTRRDASRRGAPTSTSTTTTRPASASWAA